MLKVWPERVTLEGEEMREGEGSRINSYLAWGLGPHRLLYLLRELRELRELLEGKPCRDGLGMIGG